MGVRSGRHCAPVVHFFPRWSVPLGVNMGGKIMSAAPHVWRDPGLNAFPSSAPAQSLHETIG